MNYSAQGHLIILFNVLIFGGLMLGDHVTGPRALLWLGALLLVAFAPILWRRRQ